MEVQRPLNPLLMLLHSKISWFRIFELVMIWCIVGVLTMPAHANQHQSPTMA